MASSSPPVKEPAASVAEAENAAPILRKDGPLVVCAVKLPPPVNGNSLVTAFVVGTLCEAGRVRLLPLGLNSIWPQFPWIQKLAKGVLALIWGIRLLFFSRTNVRSVYMTADTGLGLWGNLTLAASARWSGLRVVLHHHSFSYINAPNRLMRILDKLIQSNGTHIFLCECMRRSFVATYGSTTPAEVISNSFMVPQPARIAPPRAALSGKVTLGHLSNLTVEKGFFEVIETFDELLRRGSDVQLRLAGPIHDPKVAQRLHEVQNAHPQRVEYLGPVDNAAKEAFFRQIDVFLFPTMYPVEAFPLVIVESLGYAVPVITYQRGCIDELVAKDAGAVIEKSSPFSPCAAEIITGWLKNPEEYARFSLGAAENGKLLAQHARQDVRRMIELCHQLAPCG